MVAEGRSARGHSRLVHVTFFVLGEIWHAGRPIPTDRDMVLAVLTFDDVIEPPSKELTDLARLMAKEQQRERLGHPAR